MSDIEALRALAEAAHDEVVRLCEPGQTWRMSIPANPARDSDLILVEAITTIGPLLDRLAAAEGVLSDGPDTWTPYDSRDTGETFLAESVLDFTAAIRAAIDGTA